MLRTACFYEKAFVQYKETESLFKADLGDEILDFIDWQSCNQMIQMLKIFYDITLKIVCSLYVTSNAFFAEISDLNVMLTET